MEGFPFSLRHTTLLFSLSTDNDDDARFTGRDGDELGKGAAQHF